MFDYHQINQDYEAMLDRAWEEYNESGPIEDNYDDHDYDCWVDEGCQHVSL